MHEKEFAGLIETLRAQGHDYVERTIPYIGGKAHIFFISQLTDRTALTQNVIKPLIRFCSSAQEPVTARRAADFLMYADELTFDTELGRVQAHVLSGMTVILFSSDREFIIANIRYVQQRAIPEPDLNYSIRGPKDCFTESLNANLSLVRYRVQDPRLRINYFQVGERTKTSVAVLYIEDIANETVVNQIQNRIQAIHVDGIGDSGELQALLQDKPFKLFPQMGIIERSDMAYHVLTEGKVLVLVDGGSLAIYGPKVFSEYFYSSDDRYDNKLFGFFARMIRYAAIQVALSASSIYVAVTSFHTDVLPSDYAILLATLRSNTPFSALIEALLLEATMELLREALLRVPKQIGPAIGIVGAIVIGQAAIAAGIFSPLLLIISAVSLMASFAIPDYTLVTPFRILKFFMIFMTGFLGFFGFTIATTTILAILVSNDSFGVPFMAPWAPFNSRDFKKSLIDESAVSKHRPEYLRTKNRTRMR